MQEKRGKQQQPEQGKTQARASSTERETAIASAKVTPRTTAGIESKNRSKLDLKRATAISNASYAELIFRYHACAITVDEIF
jgi:hypothetical protein